jgi:hypothetical protein
MRDTADAGTRIADHNLVATYDTPDEARAALTLLERHGVESGDIELFGPGMQNVPGPVTNDEQNKADMDAAGSLGRRFSAVSFVAAVVGLVAGAIVGAVVGGGAGAVAGGLLGFIVLGLLGFLYGGYASLPVSGEAWEDTFASQGGSTSVAVHSAKESEITAAVKALAGSGARRLATCGRDGQLHDVAA